MNKDFFAENKNIDYTLYYAGTELYDEGRYFTGNAFMDKDFIGDINDFNILSHSAPKISGWRSNVNAEVSQ